MRALGISLFVCSPGLYTAAFSLTPVTKVLVFPSMHSPWPARSSGSTRGVPPKTKELEVSNKPPVAVVSVAPVVGRNGDENDSAAEILRRVPDWRAEISTKSTDASDRTGGQHFSEHPVNM